MRRIIAGILAAVLAAGLAGCRKNKNDTPEDTDTIIMEQGTTEIKLALVNSGTLNPLETTSRNVQSVMNTVYEPLFTVDEKFNIVPVLAESYSLSGDGRRITVKLRDGVKWHDGTPFNAEDVTYTWNKLKNAGGLYKNTAAKISGVTILSKNEVEISLLRQELDFAYYLTFPILSRNTSYRNDFEFVPIGTGPYKYGERKENEIVFEPNAAWHGEPVAQKPIRIKLLREVKELVQAFNVNETDAILSEDADSAENPPKSSAQIKQIVSDNLVFLGFNTQNPLLSQEIRYALGMAVDKPKLLEKAAYGYGKVCDISVNPDSWAYEGAASDGYSWETAAKMLENAGYRIKNNVYSNGEQQLEFEILVNADKQQRVTVAEAISEMLTGAGFVTRVKALDYNSYLEKIQSGNYDMFLGVTQTDSPIDPIALLDGESNYFNFDAWELKELRNSLYGVCDKEAYKTIVKDIVSRFTDNPPYIPLFFTTRGVYYGADVLGITRPTLSDRYKGIESWYFYSSPQNEDSDPDGQDKSE